MKRKLPFMLCIILFALVRLPVDAEARVSIKDVEYLKGTDFVQLHFVTDKIISIPDVFYPDQNDTRRLVMRIANVDFKLGKDRFSFESPVIDYVNMRKNDNHVDVEIRLREKVNYRVFTNQSGLYIEFPRLQEAAAQAKVRSSNALLSPKPQASPVTGKRNYIRDVRVAEKSEKKVKVEFFMAHPVDYNVIPIPDPPVRLAIDLKDTRSKSLRRVINHLNVKTLRGGQNLASVFRIVFDLHHLKSYSVAQNKDVLEVEFFNPQAYAHNQKTIPGPTARSPAITNADIADQGKSEKAKPAVQNEPEVEPITTEEIDPKKVSVQERVENKNNSEDEFFSEEKSQVSGSDAAASQADDQQQDEERSDMGAIFQRETIGDTQPKWTGELRSYHLKDQDLTNLLIHFARDTGISMVFDPDISGKVTAELNNVPWDQALDIFLRQNGLGKVQEGNVIRIGKVDKLAKEADERRKLRESKRQEADLNTYTRGLSYAKAADVKKILDNSLTARGSIIFDERSNTLIIKEVPANIGVLDGLIRVLDMPNPQVAIEARIVETNSNFTEKFGIQWSPNFIADSAYGNQTTLKFPNSVALYGNQLISDQAPFLGPMGGWAINLPASGATSGAVLSLGNISNTFRLDMALSAMQLEGKGRIIQAPRLVTQNNMEAKVAQGNKIPVQTLQNNTIQVRYVDAVLELKVTPTITADDTVTMTIDIKNDAADFAQTVLGIPPMTTQSAKTTVRVRNGTTLVIGGMYKIEKATTKEGVPLLRKIPLLGSLFRSSNKRGEQRETLIFITPRIVR